MWTRKTFCYSFKSTKNIGYYGIQKINGILIKLKKNAWDEIGKSLKTDEDANLSFTGTASLNCVIIFWILGPIKFMRISVF
jgi:hypothetical protein